mgnify:CR=1 FL=1
MKVRIEDLKKSGFEVYSYEELMKQNAPTRDEEILDEMGRIGADIILTNPSTARFWFFEDEESMLKYFENGGKVGVDNYGQLIESLDEFDIEWNKRFGSTVGKPMTIEQSNAVMNEMKKFAKEWKSR